MRSSVPLGSSFNPLGIISCDSCRWFLCQSSNWAWVCQYVTSQYSELLSDGVSTSSRTNPGADSTLGGRFTNASVTSRSIPLLTTNLLIATIMIFPVYRDIWECVRANESCLPAAQSCRGLSLANKKAGLF